MLDLVALPPHLQTHVTRYHTLNMFDSSVSGMLQGRGWVLKNQQERVIAAVQASHSEPGATAFIQRVNGEWPRNEHVS